MKAATRQPQDTANGKELYMSMELAKKTWKLTSTDGGASRPRQVTIEARDLGRMEQEIAKAKCRFGLPEEAGVRTCYEAGRDGFWIHRALAILGIDNIVVDPSSIAVNRRLRRAKTDRLDGIQLLTNLVRHWAGERVWSVARVPSVADEDGRQLHRDLEILKGERRSHRQRIQSLLFAQGIDLQVGRKFGEALPTLKQWDGQALPAALRGRLEREHERLKQVNEQILAIEKERKALLESCLTKSVEMARLMSQLRGVGSHGAWVLAMEIFGWRKFANRREVGGCAGMTGTPYDSGDSERDQGISKAGNKRVRSLMVELGWCWLRYQPDSKLTQWFLRRFGSGGKRMRRVGIVALARRLLIDLWRLVEFGVVPDGARLKTA